MCKLNNLFLNSTQINKEIKVEIKHYPKNNEIEMSHQVQLDASKAVLRQKFIPEYVKINEQKTAHIKN